MWNERKRDFYSVRNVLKYRLTKILLFTVEFYLFIKRLSETNKIGNRH